MENIKVESGRYTVTDLDKNKTLYTMELDDEIACVFFSIKLKKIALARNLIEDDLKKLIQEMNTANLSDESLIEVKIVGGDGSTESEDSLRSLMEFLMSIDNGTNIIVIVGSDIGTQVHPNSFAVNCVDGSLID